MLFRSDRKSTRLNSSYLVISYAVFCLKKKKKNNNNTQNHLPPTIAQHYLDPSLSYGTLSRAALAAHLGLRAWCFCCVFCFFFLMIRAPPKFSLFPHQAPFRF